MAYAGALNPWDLRDWEESEAARSWNSGAGDTASSARQAESEIPHSISKRGSGGGLKNFFTGKITKKRAIVGGGIAGLLVTAVIGGGAMMSLQWEHMLRNFDRNVSSFSNQSFARRTLMAWNKKFYDNGVQSTPTKIQERIFGISERRVDLYRRNGFELICGGRPCTSADAINGKIHGARIFDQVSSATYDHARQIPIGEASRRLGSVYQGRMSRFFTTKYNNAVTKFFGTRFGRTIRTGINKINPNRKLQQWEIDNIIRDYTAGQTNTSSIQGAIENALSDDRSAQAEFNSQVDHARNRARSGAGDGVVDQGARRNAGNIAKTLTQSQRQAIARALNVTGLLITIAQLATNLNCAVYNALASLVDDQNFNKTPQRASLALSNAAALEQVKMGNGEPEVLESIMGDINAQSSYSYQYWNPATNTEESRIVTKTGPESDAWKYYVEGKTPSELSLPMAVNLNWYTVQSMMQALTPSLPGFVGLWLNHSTSSKNITFCRIMSNKWLNIGITVVGVGLSIVGFFLSGGFSGLVQAGAPAVLKVIGASLLIAGAVLTLNLAFEHFADVMVQSAIGNVFDSGKAGPWRVASFFSGLAYNEMIQGQQSSLLTASPNAMRVAYAENQAYLADLAKEQREKFSPFDASSTYTFIGTFLSSILPQSTALSSPSGFLGGIGRLFGSAFGALVPSVSAADEYVAFERRITNSWCANQNINIMEGDDNRAEDDFDFSFEEPNMNIAVDISCTPFRTTNANHSSPDVLRYLIDRAEVEMVRLPQFDGTTRFTPMIHRQRFVGVATVVGHDSLGRPIYNCLGNPMYSVKYDDDDEDEPESFETHEFINDGGINIGDESSVETMSRCFEKLTGIYEFQKNYGGNRSTDGRVTRIGEKTLPEANLRVIPEHVLASLGSGITQDERNLCRRNNSDNVATPVLVERRDSEGNIMYDEVYDENGQLISRQIIYDLVPAACAGSNNFASGFEYIIIRPDMGRGRSYSWDSFNDYQMKGYIGVDQNTEGVGHGERTKETKGFYSLFFIDYEIEESLNGGLIYGEVVRSQ
ncbi:hypothetical protein FWH09_00340 [Candidatus Saccharibacteria bacterium]|nr:hypothetical protein [Candidatus Saccharibacteria bacterium]